MTSIISLSQWSSHKRKETVKSNIFEWLVSFSIVQTREGRHLFIIDSASTQEYEKNQIFSDIFNIVRY